MCIFHVLVKHIFCVFLIRINKSMGDFFFASSRVFVFSTMCFWERSLVVLVSIFSVILLMMCRMSSSEFHCGWPACSSSRRSECSNSWLNSASKRKLLVYVPLWTCLKVFEEYLASSRLVLSYFIQMDQSPLVVGPPYLKTWPTLDFPWLPKFMGQTGGLENSEESQDESKHCPHLTSAGSRIPSPDSSSVPVLCPSPSQLHPCKWAFSIFHSDSCLSLIPPVPIHHPNKTL